MKPLIGVSSSVEPDDPYYKVTTYNMRAIEQAGGIPLVLSYLEDEAIKEIAEKLDGLYLTGGNDIDPNYFQEEPHPNLGYFHPGRDAFEMKMARLFLQSKKPILGVCKGAQMLNLAAGGDMFQDTASQMEGELLQHTQQASREVPTHDVTIEEGSLLHQIVGENVIRVNSFHHQSNRTPGENLTFSGIARDGVMEAVESTVHPFALGLQWHPETMAVTSQDEPSKRIFEEFVKACKVEQMSI